MRCGGDSPLVYQCRQAANLCLGTVFALPFGSLFICPTVPESPFPNPSRQSLPAAVCLACNLSLNAPDLTAANTFGFPSPAVQELRGHKALLKLANFLAVKKPKTALLIAGKPQSTFPLSPFSPSAYWHIKRQVWGVCELEMKLLSPKRMRMRIQKNSQL